MTRDMVQMLQGNVDAARYAGWFLKENSRWKYGRTKGMNQLESIRR